MAFYIENRIGISAPPEVIWAIISDIEGWGAWTGLYHETSGALRIGERITAQLVLPGEKPERIRWTVLDWTPGAQIHLRLKLFGGLLTNTRYLEIEKLGDAGCIFGNGEIFRGPMTRFVPRRLRVAVRQAFLDMSEALKVKAEAAWAEQGRKLG